MATGAIKVNRLALITKLEEAKAKLDKQLARMNQLTEEFDLEVEKWREGAKKHIIEVSSPRYGNTYEVKLSEAYIARYPKKKPFDPKKPNEVEPSWGVKQDIKNLSETLAMLKLSEEQTVSQSMLKNLAQYLA
jgi:aspartate/methionine/tyrosine aminotransferase